MDQTYDDQAGPAMNNKRELIVRSYRRSDLDAVIAIFLEAIRRTAAKDYSPDQIRAWAQVDWARWAVLRLSRPTWIALIDQEPAGFTDLERDGHLDMMFVHPNHQRTGVGAALLACAEANARKCNLSLISAQASLTARPFFENRGFRLIAS